MRIGLKIKTFEKTISFRFREVSSDRLKLHFFSGQTDR